MMNASYKPCMFFVVDNPSSVYISKQLVVFQRCIVEEYESTSYIKVAII